MMTIERVQTGVRLEKRLLKVLKSLAEHQDLSLGELLELVLLHTFEKQHPFTPETLKVIRDLKRVYGMDYDVHAYRKFREK
jgi:hypothetical protein